MHGATLQWTDIAAQRRMGRETIVDRDTTIVLLVISLLLGLLAFWGDGRRRRAPHGGLALLPWHGMMFVALVGVLFMGVHLLGFYGIKN